MKDCNDIIKHNTCKLRAWNGDRSRLRCNSSLPTCTYKPDYIRFEDIKNDTIMYPGDIEGTYEFKTKAEWLKEIHEDTTLQHEYGDIWHTARIEHAEIGLMRLLEDIQDTGDVHENWYDDVYLECEKDPVVQAGIAKLNEIFRKSPTFFEDLQVVFD
jgi:hypothetical protein